MKWVCSLFFDAICVFYRGGLIELGGKDDLYNSRAEGVAKVIVQNLLSVKFINRPGQLSSLAVSTYLAYKIKSKSSIEKTIITAPPRTRRYSRPVREKA